MSIVSQGQKTTSSGTAAQGLEPRREAARAALVAFLATGPVMIRRLRTDHFGRTLALISVNGKDAGAMLRKAGLARRWK
jgi:endonuclease YncB( thermonuclease family)